MENRTLMAAMIREARRRCVNLRGIDKRSETIRELGSMAASGLYRGEAMVALMNAADYLVLGYVP